MRLLDVRLIEGMAQGVGEMITKEKLSELRISDDAHFLAFHDDILRTIESLYRDIEQLEAANSSFVEQLNKNDARIEKLEKVAEAARLLDEREPKISSICGIQQTLSELDGKS